MNLSRSMADDVMSIDNSVKIIPLNGGHSKDIDSLDEWIRWLGYWPSNLLHEIEEATSKPAGDLSNEEVTLLKEYKNEEEMLKLIKKYKNDDYTKDEALKVFEYTDNHNITTLAHSKLGKEDEEKVRKLLDEYKISGKKPTGRYNDMSASEALALRIIVNKELLVDLENIQNEVNAEDRHRGNGFSYGNYGNKILKK